MSGHTELQWSLLLFVTVATVSPGGATALATASGAQFGFQRSLPLMGGIAFGLSTLAGAAAAGLAGVLLALPSFQLVLKGGGSAYLLALAWKVGRAERPSPESRHQRPLTFVAGAMLLWLNPKGWTMTLSAAATFTEVAPQPGELAILLGGAFGVAASMSLSIWCVAGSMLARVLRTDRQWRFMNAGMGLLLAASVFPIWLK